MPDPTITARSARYRARAKDRGLVEVRVRVPADRAQEIRDEAARMRREAESAGDTEMEG